MISLRWRTHSCSRGGSELSHRSCTGDAYGPREDVACCCCCSCKCRASTPSEDKSYAPLLLLPLLLLNSAENEGARDIPQVSPQQVSSSPPSS